MTWQSTLHLKFDYRATSEKTRLCHCLHKGALMVQRPLYPEPNTSEKLKDDAYSVTTTTEITNANVVKSQSGICHIYVLYPPAGIADGDKLDLQFDLDPFSHAVITTPGAGKWYGQRKSLRQTNVTNSKSTIESPLNQTPTEQPNSDQKYLDTQASLIAEQKVDSMLKPKAAHKLKPKAEQNMRVKLADNAILEWLPQESIYFDHSVSNADNTFELAKSASLLTWDIAVFGRQAHNETFANGGYNNRLQIWRDNQLLVSEHTQQQADSRWFHSPLGLNNQHVHGSFWAIPSLDNILVTNSENSSDAKTSSTCKTIDTHKDIDTQSQSLQLTHYLDDTIRKIRKLIDAQNLPIESTHNYQAINCRYIGTDVRACFEAFYQVREILREEWFQIQPHRPRIWDT